MTAFSLSLSVIQRQLLLMADLLDVLGEDHFRARAYRQASEQLAGRDLSELVAAGFTGVPKVGAGLRGELMSMAETGVLLPLEAVRARLPKGLEELLGVRGLGAKKIRLLWDEGIENLDDLLEAARSGKLASLKGFGAKSVANLQAAAEFMVVSRSRRLWTEANAQLGAVLGVLVGFPVSVAGELAAGLETVGKAEAVVVAASEEVAARLGQGWTREGSRFVREEKGGFLLVIHVAAPEELGKVVALTFPHWAAELSEAAGEPLADLAGSFPSEESLCAALGVSYRAPELREPEQQPFLNDFPSIALTEKDLRGALHTHSLWSDGTATIAEMVRGATELGYEYLGIADHSRSAGYAGGLSIERLQAQIAEIRELQRAGLPVLAGTEVDILEDGSLDYPDELLAELDYVVASVHSGFALSREAQTERLVRAVSHPMVTILGHATGRKLLARPSYDLDLDAVLGACEQYRTAVEINANPVRLDLDWRIALPWRDRLYWAINTDAHSIAGLAHGWHGVRMARKAGLRTERVINTFSAEELLGWKSNKSFR